MELEVDDYEDNDDMARIRSHLKGDLCPLAAQKKFREKSTVLMLLSRATTEFVEEDLRPQCCDTYESNLVSKTGDSTSDLIVNGDERV